MYQLNIVLINYNTCDLAVKCLTNLFKECEPVSCTFTVVDNASVDGSAEILKEKFSNIIVVQNRFNLGFGAACNEGVLKAPKSKYLLFVNSDTVPQKKAVSQMIEFMEQNEDCGILGPCLRDFDGKLQNSFANWPSIFTEFFGKYILRALNPGRYPLKSKKHTNPFNVESVVGAFFMIRSSVFKQVMGFDERYYFFLEETDLCRKVILAGKKVIFHPNITVFHLQGASANKNPLWSRTHFYRAKYQFLQKWEPEKFKIIFIKNFLSLWGKSFFYTFLTLFSKKGSHFESKRKISFMLAKNHRMGFPPPEKLALHQREDQNILFLNHDESYFPDLKWLKRCLIESKNGSVEHKGDTYHLLFFSQNKNDFPFNFDLSIKKLAYLHLIRSQMFQKLKIPVINPLGFGICKDTGILFFLAKAEPGSKRLDVYLREEWENACPDLKKQITKLLVLYLHAMEEKNIFYPSLSPENVFIKSFENICLYFSDLHQIQFSFFYKDRLRKMSVSSFLEALKNYSSISEEERNIFEKYLGDSALSANKVVF